MPIDTTTATKPTLPDIPKSYIVIVLAVALCVLRAMGIDSYTTAGLGLLIGYVTGKHIEQTNPN